MNPFVLGCLLGALAYVGFAAATPDGTKVIPSVSPDPRVRWEPYSVGGLGLCDRDSCVTIPPGSVLWVPYPVPDSVTTEETS